MHIGWRVLQQFLAVVEHLWLPGQSRLLWQRFPLLWQERWKHNVLPSVVLRQVQEVFCLQRLLHPGLEQLIASGLTSDLAISGASGSNKLLSRPAPNTFRIRPRESVPFATPFASSSKECSFVAAPFRSSAGTK
jgi:hypothetical protein